MPQHTFKKFARFIDRQAAQKVERLGLNLTSGEGGYREEVEVSFTLLLLLFTVFAALLLLLFLLLLLLLLLL